MFLSAIKTAELNKSLPSVFGFMVGAPSTIAIPSASSQVFSTTLFERFIKSLNSKKSLGGYPQVVNSGNRIMSAPIFFASKTASFILEKL